MESINISEVIANATAEGIESPEVEAILTALSDDPTWKIEGFKSMSNPEKIIDNMKSSGRLAQLGIPLPSPVNTSDRHVIAIAKFAVAKYNVVEHQRKLVFICVTGGLQWKLVIGTLYILIILTQDSKGTHTDYAVAFETFLGQKYLFWYKH